MAYVDRREQVTRIVEAVYSRGDTPEANEVRIIRMFELAVKLEAQAEKPAPQASAGPRPEPQKTDKSAKR